MDTTIRIRGWITEARVIHPVRSYESDKEIYKLKLQPETPRVFDDIEDSIRSLKDSHQSSFKARDPLTEEVTHPDVWFDGCDICFKTFRRPRLLKTFSKYTSDEELMGKFAQAVGNIQIMKDLNIFLSVHILEPIEPLEGFDPIE